MDAGMRLRRSLGMRQKLFPGRCYIVRWKRLPLRVKEPDV